MARSAEYCVYNKYSHLIDLQSNSLDLYLASCGHQCCTPSHTFGPGEKENCIIHAVKSGKGTLLLDGKTYKIHENQAFFIPANTEVWYQADAEEPWEYTWIGLEGLKAKEVIASEGFSLKQPVRDIGCTEQLFDYVHQMLQAHQLSYSNALKRDGLLMLCMACLIEDYVLTDETAASLCSYSGEIYVNYAQEYIKKNFQQKLKINDLADHIGVNRSYLTKNFKAIVGCSPQKLLIDLRIERAKMLLTTTQMPINEIALDVGYSDQLSFSRLFKRCCGRSPRAYRNQESDPKLNIVGQEAVRKP